MAKPPKTPPSSDIAGVNRDVRAGSPSRNLDPEPGGAIHRARNVSKGRPDEGATDLVGGDAADSE